MDIRHLRGTHRYANDTGLLTLRLDRDEFTVSVDDALAGGVWYAEAGVYLSADGVPDFAAYRALDRDAATISQRVRRHPEQSFAGAFQGLPRPHAVETHVACRHLRQRFMIEPNGDIVLRASACSRSAVPGATTSMRGISSGWNAGSRSGGRSTPPPPPWPT